MSENLAGLVRQHRKLSKLTQQQLAELAGVGKTAVFDIEHGKSTVQLATLQRILHVLNIKVKAVSPITQQEQELF